MKRTEEETPQPYTEHKFKLGAVTVISRTWYYLGSEENPESEGFYCSFAIEGSNGAPVMGMVYHDKQRDGMMREGRQDAQAFKGAKEVYANYLRSIADQVEGLKQEP